MPRSSIRYYQNVPVVDPSEGVGDFITGINKPW